MRKSVLNDKQIRLKKENVEKEEIQEDAGGCERSIGHNYLLFRSCLSSLGFIKSLVSPFLSPAL